MDLKGKAAIVTGGGSGMGRATALRFAEAGSAVLVADIDGSAANDVASAISKQGGRARAFQGDLTQPRIAEAMVESALAAFGQFDFAFNNVGGAIPGAEVPLHDLDLDIFEADLRLNLHATLYCLRAELPHLLKRGKGAIVNTSSLAGLGGSMSNVSYVMGKHGIVGLTKYAAIVYGPHNIRVNAICPGSIDTPMLQKNFAGNPDWRKLLAHAALERIGQPEEVANLVVWLCSDEASFMSGAAIPIDGGTSAFAVRVGSTREKN